MKRIHIALLLFFVLLTGSIAGCAPSSAQQAAPPTPEPAEETAPVGLVNPLRETDEAGLVEATGLSLPAPEGAENVRRSYLAIPNEAPIAQLEFTLDGAEATLRARPSGLTEPMDISGLYYEWTESASAQVGYCTAQLHTNGDAGYIAWVDVVPGILYNLAMNRGASAEKLSELANAAFFPVQGEVGGDEAGTAAEEDAERYAPYRELVEYLTEGIRDGWTTMSLEGVGVSDVFSRSGHEDIGWTMADVNGDGTDELLFGENGEDGQPGPIYDIYTILNGEMIHPVCGWDFSLWYVDADGVLVNAVSSSGYDWYYAAYGFYNGMLVQGFRAADRSSYQVFDFLPFREARADAASAG